MKINIDEIPEEFRNMTLGEYDALVKKNERELFKKIADGTFIPPPNESMHVLVKGEVVDLLDPFSGKLIKKYKK